MGSILPQGKTRFFDNDGNPLSGGSVTFYALGTTNYQTTYQDQNLTIPNTNPTILDGGGSAIIWGTGAYTMVVKDSLGNQIYSADTTSNTTDEEVQSGALRFAVDNSKTANVITLNFTPQIESFSAGQEIFFQVANNNAPATPPLAAPTINGIPLVSKIGPLVGTELIKNAIYSAVYSDINGEFVLNFCSAGSLVGPFAPLAGNPNQPFMGAAATESNQFTTLGQFQPIVPNSWSTNITVPANTPGSVAFSFTPSCAGIVFVSAAVILAEISSWAYSSSISVNGQAVSTSQTPLPSAIFGTYALKANESAQILIACTGVNVTSGLAAGCIFVPNTGASL